jgi:FtsP/CotA-like multicopper oxidase with cupredoxin domain
MTGAAKFVVRRRALSLLSAIVLVGAGAPGHANHADGARDADRVVPNDNRVPAGTLRGGVLRLRLVARTAEWHPDGDDKPGAPMMAFAEENGPARIPGPLVRVPVRTEVAASVRNALGDTLRVYGLWQRGQRDTVPVPVAPGETREIRFRLDAPGTFLYYGTTMRRPMGMRVHEDAQLSGAIVVDPAGSHVRDRIFVLGEWSDTVDRSGVFRHRVLAVINGRSFPNTERQSYAVGDTVRWRVINASADLHPMHLHGFYFRVTSRSDNGVDSIYRSVNGQPAGDLAVTEGIFPGRAIALLWVPERAGNWLFHCHIPEHFGRRGPLGTEAPPRTEGMHDHARGGMNGLVLGITVRPSSRSMAERRTRPTGPERHLRLLVRPNAGSSDTAPSFGYALHEGGTEPPVDSGGAGAPTLDLVRGQPVRITVVNRLPDPTAVHWHGIELESYYDGVPGFSGAGTQTTPLIAPGDSFEVRFTPPRAGTFIYHTHADELRQQAAGLAAAIVVREPGTTRDPAVDIPLVFTSPVTFALNRRVALVNGSASPRLLTMTAGRTYRLRLVGMPAYRTAYTIEIHRGDGVVTWRPLAKDGAALATPYRVQEARAFLQVGETQDYELTPTDTGDLRLDVHLQGRLGLSPRGVEQAASGPLGPRIIVATLPIRVVPAPRR